ncbi:MAG: ornithine carbamoyltransferase [Pseudomonadota bacterium]
MTAHFLVDTDLDAATYRAVLERARALKALQKSRTPHRTLEGRVLAMIFEKSSTRTRVSFETGIFQLGGVGLYLSTRDSQLGRGEPIADTARALSEMVDGIMIRTFAHTSAEELATHATIPVINGLTDSYHPCQLLADMQTWFDNRGDIRRAKVAWIGDGNNVCNSWMLVAKLLEFDLHLGCPAGFVPDPTVLAECEDAVTVHLDPREAIEQADLVITDVFASMGQEEEAAQRLSAFRGYQVNMELMAHAHRDALFMHCLPAHRGEEVTAEVIDGPQSVVWEQAGNRLHAQKALLEHLMAE